MSVTVAASVWVNNVRENTSSVVQESGDETQFKVESVKVPELGGVRVWQTHRAAHVWPFQIRREKWFTHSILFPPERLSPNSWFYEIVKLLDGFVFFCCYCCFHSHRSEVKARQDVKPDFRHPPFTDYRQPPVDYRHPPVTDYRQPPTLDYRQPPGLLDFRQHPAAAQFPLGIPADFRLQVHQPILIF